MPEGPHHLLQLEGLDRAELSAVIDLAEAWAEEAPPELLAGRTLANVFLEDSTRTRCSFELAARRLGAALITLTGSGSSVAKGETILDTARTLEAMGIDGIVLRCGASGGAQLVADHVRVPVVNAGDGRHEHPTQGLLDLMTLGRHLGDLAGRRVAIVGDVDHSRVARSNIHALTTMGADVLLVGPKALVPRDFERIVEPAEGRGAVTVGHDLDAVLETLDAIMMLRVQFERDAALDDEDRARFVLSVERAARLPDHAVILHPGPINRGVEIDGEVADDSARSVILEQVAHGVAVRTAVLAMCLAPEACGAVAATR